MLVSLGEDRIEREDSMIFMELITINGIAKGRQRLVEWWWASGEGLVPFPLFLPASRALRGGGVIPVFQSASVDDNPSASSSSVACIGEGKSRLIFAEPLPDEDFRFVFAVSAGEFGIEETTDLLGETWKPLPDKEFKMIGEIGEDNVDSQDRLAIILPQAEGKQRFLRLAPQR